LSFPFLRAVIIGIIPYAPGVQHTDFFPDFCLRALALLLPHNKIAELMSVKASSTVEVEVAFSTASKMLPSGTPLQPKRQVRDLIVEKTTPGKNTLPVITVDDVLDILLEEMLIVTERIPCPDDFKPFTKHFPDEVSPSPSADWSLQIVCIPPGWFMLIGPSRLFASRRAGSCHPAGLVHAILQHAALMLPWVKWR
jgi:hypothetical protein